MNGKGIGTLSPLGLRPTRAFRAPDASAIARSVGPSSNYLKQAPGGTVMAYVRNGIFESATAAMALADHGYPKEAITSPSRHHVTKPARCKPCDNQHRPHLRDVFRHAGPADNAVAPWSLSHERTILAVERTSRFVPAVTAAEMVCRFAIFDDTSIGGGAAVIAGQRRLWRSAGGGMSAGAQSRCVSKRLAELSATSTGACVVCGAAAADPAERFCGGDR
jgi:hypothetical protein